MSFEDRHPSKLSLNSNKSPAKIISEALNFQFDFDEILRVAKIIVRSAVPTSFTYIVGTFTGISLFKYIGTYGTPSELAGAGVGYTLVNIFCLAIFFSIDLGFSTVAARLFGAQKLRELGVVYQRNICIIAAMAVPIFSLLLFADRILVSLGLDPEVATSTGTYIRYIIPSIIGTCLFNTTRFFLVSQNIFNAQGVILAILFPIHLFWCQVFVGSTSTPVSGAAIAKSITDLSAAIILILYIKISGVCKEAWIPWTKECLQGWISHLKETLAIGGNLFVDFVSSEASVFIINLLDDYYVLGAQVVAGNFTYSTFMLTVGTLVSMHAFIGNAAGEGSVIKAKKYLVSGLFVNFMLSLFNSTVIIVFSKYISSFFISEEKSANILQNMLTIYALSHVAETAFQGIAGALRILGKENFVLKIFVIFYFGVTFNCQWIFGIAFEYGYIAVWLSRAGIIYILLFIMVKQILKLDWEAEVDKIKNNIEIRDVQETANYIELIEAQKNLPQTNQNNLHL